MHITTNIANYYQKIGLSPTSFSCPNYEKCKIGLVAGARLAKAKEPLVGVYYERHSIPRILFLSADPKDSPIWGTKRTLQANRKSAASGLEGGTPHWRETCRLAFNILRGYDVNLRNSPDNIVKYFAHTNSAKCSDGSGQGPKRRFDYCRAFVTKEILILEPDVIVTQGKRAKEVIEYGINVGDFMVSKQSIIRPQYPTTARYKRAFTRRNSGTLD